MRENKTTNDMKPIETESNLATDLMEIIHKAMLTEYNPSPFDGEQTRIVIEHPDGSYEPYSLAWYDKENNIIRLSYENEDGNEDDIVDYVINDCMHTLEDGEEYEFTTPVALSENRIATKFWVDEGNEDVRVEIRQTYPTDAWREDAFLSSMPRENKEDAIKVAKAIDSYWD